ncbi:MAG: 5'/3'-nucleotidase SurE [Anaerolineae bacterium]|nr:5'/3'-nucleotidase SurE [Anaerolineae bacterium]
MALYAELRPLILVTGDDGIDSPGLRAAVRSALDLGDVLVSAPAEQQTSAGRSQPSSFDGAIEEVDYLVDGRQVPAYAMRGSPAQAVLYALVEIVPRRPALCISGINFGENVGSNITVSGTVGAALEAASHGVPSLAVSLETDKAFHYTYSDDVDFTAAAHFVRFFAGRMLARPLPPDVDLLKIEVPAGATAATPWRMTRVSRQHYYRALPSNRRALPEKRRLDYEMVFDRATLEPDSDIHALQVDRVVAVSPVSLDMTSRAPLEQVEQLLR